MDFGVIKARLREIIGRLDHQFLNELEMFSGANPPPNASPPTSPKSSGERSTPPASASAG